MHLNSTVTVHLHACFLQHTTKHFADWEVPSKQWTYKNKIFLHVSFLYLISGKCQLWSILSDKLNVGQFWQLKSLNCKLFKLNPYWQPKQLELFINWCKDYQDVQQIFFYFDILTKPLNRKKLKKIWWTKKLMKRIKQNLGDE